MKLIGIALRRPSFSESTAAAVMGVGLWVAAVGILRSLHLDVDAVDAGALLLVIVWSSLSAFVGIRVGEGGRHLMANLLTNALILGLYQLGCSLLVHGPA